MKNLVYVFLSFYLLLTSCQEAFVPDFADEEPTIVVEGYIQSGEGTLPTYVVLSKTYPLFQTGTPTGPQVYLGGAIINVKNNGIVYPLSEICTKNLDPALKEQLFGFFGIDSLLSGLDLCFYVDLNQSIQPQEGEIYDLQIIFEGKELTARTTIPEFVPIDSLKIYDQFGIEGFRSMNAYLTDPLGPNFYRLKASVNGSPYSADFSSVTDDKIFDGQAFDFPISKPVDRSMDFDPNTAGLFAVGDSVSLEWQLLDKNHFDFWNTLEFARGNQGPFSTYSRATTNIEGGIGVWGGSAVKYYNRLIEE